jgi:hypothetical protein
MRAETLPPGEDTMPIRAVRLLLSSILVDEPGEVAATEVMPELSGAASPVPASGAVELLLDAPSGDA